MTLKDFRAALNELRPQVLATEPTSKARKLNREARAWLRNCREEAGSTHEGATAYRPEQADAIVTGLRRAISEPTEQQAFEAQEILNLHADAEAAGIAYSTDQSEIERAGWDHFPPTPAQVREARRTLRAANA